MRLQEILATYPDAALDRLAADKVDEVANLRLPRPVLLQEIASALSSLSYVARALAPSRPPTWAILKLLLDAPGYTRPADGFREAAQAITDSLTRELSEGRGLTGDKNYGLYLKLLRAAWENDSRIDRSEALMLQTLAKELGLWPREHLVLEHHPQVRPFWDSERAFDQARNHLLATGLLLSREDHYVLADEVRFQIRAAWEIDLEDAAWRRLLGLLNVNQLKEALEKMHMMVSGTKSERIERVINSLVPPTMLLDTLRLDELKDMGRACSLPLSLPKAEVVAGLIRYFDQGQDLAPEPEVPPPPPPPPPEHRQLQPNELDRLLQLLTVDQLQDILAACDLKRFGTKAERIARLIESPWSESSLLQHLTKPDLTALCRKLNLIVSGVKSELVERLIASAGTALATPEQRITTALLEPTPPPPAQLVPGATNTSEVPAVTTPVPGLRDVQIDFPDLGPDEHVVLALLKQARSLTERDIERAALRHGFGWFLTKAHMADLLGRLDEGGRNPLRIRSAGSFNIYEWVGNTSGSRDPLDRDAARDVVDALRQGVVPERHLDLLAVGQEAARAHLSKLLDHVGSGRSAFKFLRGPYGAGKTFLSAWLRDRAFQAGYAVATVRIGADQPLSDLPIFFTGIMNGLRTPEKRDTSALADLLESWLLTLHRSTAQAEGLKAFDERDRSALAPLVEQRIDTELARLAGRDPGIAPAVKAFYLAQLKSEPERASTALAWLRGSRALSADLLRAIGVRGQLEAEQVFPRIQALLEVIRGGRLRGLLLLVDELELVRRFPHARQREQAYETLRQVIDEVGENGFPGCLLVFTGTDALFDDTRYGLGSYEALSHRISAPRSVDGLVSMRQPVIVLEGLGRERLIAMALRVRQIHSSAYDWPAAARVPDAILQRMVDGWTSFGGEEITRPPRPFLREVVHLLDLCEENPGISAEACLRVPAIENEVSSAIMDLLEE